MDLITYAVNRKLTHVEDPLLEYVANGRDIPVDVIENSFEGLLSPLEDEKSSLLVEDYSKMLEKYVSVKFTSNNYEDGYEVSGEIEEELLEAINLVHGIEQEDVISELITNSSSKITSRPVSVGKLSLEELSKQMEDLTNNLSDVESFEGEGLAFEDIEPSEEEFIDDLADEVVGDLAEETDPVESYEEDYVDYYDAAAEEEDYEVDIIEEDVDYEEEELQEQQEMSEDEGLEDLEEELSDEDISEEEMTESMMLAQGIRNVYNRLVDDLKAYGLDESLGLSI